MNLRVCVLTLHSFCTVWAGLHLRGTSPPAHWPFLWCSPQKGMCYKEGLKCEGVRSRGQRGTELHQCEVDFILP